MNPPEKIIVTIAHYECCMCPTIITGTTDDGTTVYVRYRWGRLSVRVDTRDPVPQGGAAGVWIIENQLVPEGLDGCLSYDELRELTADLIEWPDELTPRIYDENDTWLEL